MAKVTKANTPANEERHNKRGALIFTTLTPENNFYRDNHNLLQMAQYLIATGKNSYKMKTEDNAIFSFTDYSIYEMIVTNADGEIIENTYFVVAYDNTTNTCYYTMSKGLTAEFMKMKDNNIIPSNGYCKWTARVIEKTFKDPNGAGEKRTFNLEIMGIDNFNSDVVVERKTPALLADAEDPAPDATEA